MFIHELRLLFSVYSSLLQEGVRLRSAAAPPRWSDVASWNHVNATMAVPATRPASSTVIQRHATRVVILIGVAANLKVMLSTFTITLDQLFGTMKVLLSQANFEIHTLKVLNAS